MSSERLTTFLAENLQHLRKARKISQQALANQLGLTRSKVASYENGNAEPNAAKLAQLARFFNVSLNQLIEEDLSNIPSSQMLAANTNIQEEIVDLLFNRDEIIQKFEQKSTNFKKITEGFKAFYELRKDTLNEDSKSMESMLFDFENLLRVMDKLVASNEELIFFLKKITAR